ncbi:MAG: choice-of-anchor tandem repeat GloVer-containing protein [Candidatus Korobacteraceae bacterium]
MTKLRTHRSFAVVPAQSPDGGSLEKLSLPAMICIVVLFFAEAVIAVPAQNNGVLFNSLYSFAASGQGANPGYEVLVLGSDGDFYGTTMAGQQGIVFKITSGGTLTRLYNFCSRPGCSDGASPYAGLVQGSDGDFYGTTAAGGTAGNFYSYNYGTLFKITPAGALSTLHSFSGRDGSGPESALLLASDVNFYGTTNGGGANNSCDAGCGTIFKITPAGTLTTLYNFCALQVRRKQRLEL